MKRGRKLTDLSGHDIDWTLPASHIAFDLGLSIGSILNYMRRNNIPVKRPGAIKGTKRSTIHTTSFDWSKKDYALASDYNFTREYIRQIRKSRGEPASGSTEWNKKYHSA